VIIALLDHGLYVPGTDRTCHLKSNWPHFCMTDIEPRTRCARNCWSVFGRHLHCWFWSWFLNCW